MQVAQSEAARESELFRPSSFSALCPELLELFGHALALPASAAAAEGSPGAGRRRRSSRGTVAADEEAAAAAAAAAAVAAEGDLPPLQEEEPPLSAGFTAGGPPSEFGGLSAGGFSAGGFEPEPEDMIEPADTQQEQQAAAAAGLFAAGGEAEEGLEAERRGRLPLQPVPYSGEEPAELGSIGERSWVGWVRKCAGATAAHDCYGSRRYLVARGRSSMPVARGRSSMPACATPLASNPSNPILAVHIIHRGLLHPKPPS